MTKKPARRARVVMPDRDKEDIRINVLRNFQRLGAGRDDAERTLSAGSVPIWTWMSRWICHHTDYPETREITQDKFFLSFYAWIRYKATAEVLGDADESRGEEKSDEHEDQAGRD